MVGAVQLALMPDDPSKQPAALTVSQLTREVKTLLENDIGSVWVAGEISNWRVSPAGHAYFTLKDDKSQLSAVMFKGHLRRLKMEPEGGLEVIVYGRVTVYEQRGQYQIICEQLQPKGVGALQIAFEKLKQKLADEGLFDEDRKKPLPLFPARIGIVTSPTGAAIRDMLNVINRRFAHVHIVLYPARVQGDEAPPEIVHGIKTLDTYGVDVIVVGRGGGSLEDLWAFNDERVVRAVAEAKTPIVSAVGHEIDFSLSDFAADVRAPTPSAAAEIVVQERSVIADRVAHARKQMALALTRRIESLRYRVDRVAGSAPMRRPEAITEQTRQRVDDAREGLEASIRDRASVSRIRMDQAARSIVLLSPQVRVARTYERLQSQLARLRQSTAHIAENRRARLERYAAQLDGLSPLRVLQRGYAVAWKLPERTIVRDAHALSPGDQVSLRFASGAARALIEAIEEETDGEE